MGQSGQSGCINAVRYRAYTYVVVRNLGYLRDPGTKRNVVGQTLRKERRVEG